MKPENPPEINSNKIYGKYPSLGWDKITLVDM